MILTDQAKKDFQIWYKENYSYLSTQNFNNNEEFDKFLKSNNVLIYSLILIWLDRIEDLGKGKTIQFLIKKSIKDYEYVLSWIDHQKHVIEKANVLYNVKFSQADA